MPNPLKPNPLKHRSGLDFPTLMKQPWHKFLFYRFMRIVFRLWAVLMYRYRVFGMEHFPDSGGALVCSNHQSNLDPPLVGIASQRHLNFLAKQSLFKFPLNIPIYLLDAIPIDRSGMGIAGIKETLKRAKRGEMILLFPEGQRTFDGEMNRLMPGFITVARRTKVPLVPVALDGAFQSWPRFRHFPLPGRVVVVVGPPIEPEDFLPLDDDQIIALLHHRIHDCFQRARAARGRLIDS